MAEKNYGYRVKIRSEVIRDVRSGGKYGDWFVEQSNYFGRISRDDNWPDVTSQLEIPPGTECYVVWAEWSSGDSFGRGTNNNCESLGVFTDKLSAEVFAKTLRNTKAYSMKITTPDKQTYSVYCGWIGYFENLTDIHIEHTVMQKKENR